MSLGSTERECANRTRRFVKTESKRAVLSYAALTQRLKEHGLEETKASITVKLNQCPDRGGVFSNDNEGDWMRKFAFGRCLKVSDRWLPAAMVIALIGAMFYVLHTDLPQPSAPPTHQIDNQSGGSGKNNKDNKGKEPETIWQKITRDPVAFTTLCLTAVTGILAASTMGLWIVTARSGKRQSQDMKASIRIAERALIEVERAFVAVRDLSVTTIMYSDNFVAAFNIPINIVNSGRTPAVRYVTNHTVAVFEKVPDDFRFPDRMPHRPGFNVIGPQTQSFMSADLAIQDAIDIHEGRKIGLIYGWIEYDDIFEVNQRHRTEFCVQITTFGDPRFVRIVPQGQRVPPVLSFPTYGSYNATDQNCRYKPSETPVAEPYELPTITQPPPNTEPPPAYPASESPYTMKITNASTAR